MKTDFPELEQVVDEAWAYFKDGTDFTDDALVLQDWPSEAKDWQDHTLGEDFAELFAFRHQVNEKLEALRSSGEIGRSLDAYVRLSGNPKTEAFARLQRYAPLLEEFFIVSQVELATQTEPEIAIAATKASGGRCPRCWRWEPQLTSGTDNERTCSRCDQALNQA